jgi:hypothetical protein
MSLNFFEAGTSTQDIISPDAQSNVSSRSKDTVRNIISTKDNAVEPFTALQAWFLNTIEPLLNKLGMENNSKQLDKPDNAS